MLYQELREIITSKEQYRWLPTVYEIKGTSYDTRDNKMALVIRIIQLLNWSKLNTMSNLFKAQRPFNEKAYRQSIANCVSYASKPEMVFGNLINALVELVADLNVWLPQKFDKRLLREMINTQIETNTKQEYDDFFNGSLTDYEKGAIEDKKQKNELTGQSDLDWKAMSFVFNIKGKDVIFNNRNEINKLTLDETLVLLEQKIKDNWFHCSWLEILYSNMDKLEGRSRWPVIKLMLTAMLFIQDYNKYPWLVKNYEKIKVLTDNK